MNKEIQERIQILNDIELPWYIKDDLIDLLEDYPDLFKMSASALTELARGLWSEADGYSSKAARLENDAPAIEKYCKAKYGEEQES